MSDHHHHHQEAFNPRNPDLKEVKMHLDRRAFLTKTSMGLGAMALGSLLGGNKLYGGSNTKTVTSAETTSAAVAFPNYLPKAKRIVYLFQSGGPSQIDMFDYKPALDSQFGKDLPDSVRKGQRLTGMSADQASLPVTPSLFKFKQYGECRAWVSELMPHTAEMVDDICFIKSMHTEAINHDPATTFFQTGNQIAGRPSIGSWLSYGLGSDNENLPAFRCAGF